MFTNVTISNFRTFETATLDDLGPTTALIGRNASGKSNLLHALEVFGGLASATDGGAIGTVWASSLFLPERWPAFATDISLPDGRYHYSLSVIHALTRSATTKRSAPHYAFTERLDVTSGKSAERRKPVFKRDGETIAFADRSPDIRTGQDMPALVALSALLPFDSPVRQLTEPLRRFFARVRYYPLDEPARDEGLHHFFSGSKYNKWVNEYPKTGVLGDLVSTQIPYLALTAEARFTELKDRLGRRGLRLVDDITFLELTGKGLRPPQLDPSTGLLDPNTLYMAGPTHLEPLTR